VSVTVTVSVPVPWVRGPLARSHGRCGLATARAVPVSVTVTVGVTAGVTLSVPVTVSVTVTVSVAGLRPGAVPRRPGGCMGYPGGDAA